MRVFGRYFELALQVLYPALHEMHVVKEDPAAMLYVPEGNTGRGASTLGAWQGPGIRVGFWDLGCALWGCGVRCCVAKRCGMKAYPQKIKALRQLNESAVLSRLSAQATVNEL